MIGVLAAEARPSDEWTTAAVAVRLHDVPDDASPEVRASDAEREQAANALRDHLTEGRLTLDELAERLDGVYAARTRAELEAVTRDLPAAATPTPPAKLARRRLVAIMSGIDRSQRWRLERETSVLAVMGGVHLDLRAAEIEGPEASISCTAIMGGIDIEVPEGLEVEVSGFGLMGGVADEVSHAPPLPGAPRVHIHAFALMGGVSVRSKRRSGSGADRVPDRLQLEE